MTRPLTLPLDPDRPDPEILTRAARLLYEGEIIAAPSDTVYGFLALPRNLRARVTLSGLKNRPGPFIVLVSSWEEARSWTRKVTENIWERLHKVWPGPVTVILPTAKDMPGALDSAIGLRMPDSVFLRALLLEVGEPLFSTSANRPGEDPPVRVEEVMKGISKSVALVLDAGPADSREPSTVVDMAHGPPKIVRKGRGDAGPLLDPTLSPF